MKTTRIEFQQNARRVYTATKRAVGDCKEFHRVHYDDRNFIITAKHGASLLALGESVEVRVAATGTQSSEVVIQSSKQIAINIFNIGYNKHNVITLEEYIRNRVYRICSDEEIKLRTR